MNTTKILRNLTASTIAAAALATVGATLPASASTSPGSCDFGHVAVTDFVCIDSDDLRNAAGPAHTDNGVLDDALDVDWYEQIGGLNRHVRVRGSLFIDAGAVGKATLRVQCISTSGSVIDSKSRELVSNSSFHTGLDKDVSINCTGANLDKIRVKVTFQDFGGTRSNTEAVKFKGN